MTFVLAPGARVATFVGDVAMVAASESARVTSKRVSVLLPLFLTLTVIVRRTSTVAAPVGLTETTVRSCRSGGGFTVTAEEARVLSAGLPSTGGPAPARATVAVSVWEPVEPGVHVEHDVDGGARGEIGDRLAGDIGETGTGTRVDQAHVEVLGKVAVVRDPYRDVLCDALYGRAGRDRDRVGSQVVSVDSGL